MARKLMLDVSDLQVSSFETGEAVRLVGTVKGNDLLGGIKVTQTNCLTTPCCAPTVTCLTQEF
jgi:hypothetical protein